MLNKLSIVGGAGLLYAAFFLIASTANPAGSTVIKTPEIVNAEPEFLSESRVIEFYEQYKDSTWRINDRARNFYYPQAVKMFEEAGFSPEMSRLYAELPTVESNWEPSARSVSNAIGFWQQISSTAGRFGLKNTNGLDDRMDFLKSTRGAIRHIKALHELFNGDPVKVLFAYNGGESEMIRKLKVHSTNNAFAVNFTRDETFDFAPKVIGAYLYYRDKREVSSW
jgi:membrane-bound lytic murein transglycosylase D